MASWKEFYGGQYLTAEQLGKRKIIGKILECGPETIINAKSKSEGTKIVIAITHCDKKIALNKGNVEALDSKFGEDYKKWIGKNVSVTTDWTTYQGEKCRGIVVSPLGIKGK